MTEWEVEFKSFQDLESELVKPEFLVEVIELSPGGILCELILE